VPKIEVKPGIYWIGVNDRTTDLFEGIWPITSEGVSYNSYVIDGDKKVLVDITKDFKAGNLLDQIAEVFPPSDLDYVVINHMEPDHTGALRMLKRVAPDVTFLCSSRAEDMLANYYQITEGVQVVEDGETLDLGTHELQFFITPMVHWPETMVTYETGHKVLFSCDAFGGYGAFQGQIFDDDCNDLEWYEHEALRYYANIVAMFPRPVFKAIDKLADVDVGVVAPSHGLIWRNHPERIIKLYQEWSEAVLNEPDPGVTLVYATMYGNTEQMMEAVAAGVARAGLPVEIFDVRHIHTSYILPSVVKYNGVLVGAPTYEGKLFPVMAHTLDMIARKKIKERRIAYFGSYGWSGGARREVKSIAEDMGWELYETWEFAGGAKTPGLNAGEAFGYQFAEYLKSEPKAE
jgi:flavorubredoxin